MSVDRAMDQLRTADRRWASALVAHRLAPPDAGYPRRLRELADACEQEQLAYEYAARQGLTWGPPEEAAGTIVIPHELSPNSGRRGPAELWRRFDLAVEDLLTALRGISLTAIARGFAELSYATRELATAVVQEDTAAHGGESAQGDARPRR
jgi:hypothetical protein